MRLIVDFYNIDNTLSVNSTGQSGQPLHKNYQNQSRLWAYGDYKINKFTESEMIIARFTVMRLLPR
jgi:acyl-homoserine lactone acylase PvdQ